MIPNPIRKVLSSMRAHRVRALLMGGQACVFYGAAEFSTNQPSPPFSIQVLVQIILYHRAFDAVGGHFRLGDPKDAI